MKISAYSSIQRYLGVIEGCTADMSKEKAEYIFTAISGIEEIINEEMVGED